MIQKWHATANEKTLDTKSQEIIFKFSHDNASYGESLSESQLFNPKEGDLAGVGGNGGWGMQKTVTEQLKKPKR